ncbi:MAG: hypothetical protein ABI182_02740, partial [Candidatus Baltobacteraceae bacterium]
MKLFLRIATVIAALVLAIGLEASLPRAALAQDVNFISIDSGHSLVLSIAGLSRVAVGDGTIAGVVPVGTSQ